MSAPWVTSGVSGSSTASVSTRRPSASSSTWRIALASGGCSSSIAWAPRAHRDLEHGLVGRDDPGLPAARAPSVASSTSSSIASVRAPRSSGVSTGSRRPLASARDFTGRAITRTAGKPSVRPARRGLAVASRRLVRTTRGVRTRVDASPCASRRPRSRAVARVAFQVACAVAGSLLVAGLAQISFTLPFTPVPITGQTLGVLLVGAAYGPALGAATLGLYLVLGRRRAAGARARGRRVARAPASRCCGSRRPPAGTSGGSCWRPRLTGWLAPPRMGPFAPRRRSGRCCSARS